MKIYWFYFLCSIIILTSCIEEFEPENTTNILEGTLVVDARITDQNKQHTILLSRTFDFGTSNPNLEIGAEVRIIDDAGLVIDFPEISPGNYCTTEPISLSYDRLYTLEVKTSDGLKYISNEEKLPNSVELTKLWGERRMDENGVDGIAILIGSEGDDLSSGYFRYEFEETYKIVPPDFNPFDWDEVDYDFFCEDDDGWEVTVAPRTEQVNVCFAFNKSNTILLASTANLISNSLENFEVRFINSDNHSISHRYSILVKQYHHNSDAASFYRSLEDFSTSETIFSNVQTGMLEGNIRVQNSDNTTVFGYFELSSYSEKRIFFNYEDFYPDEPLPPYIISCDFVGKPALYPEGFHVTVIDGKPVIDGNSNSPLIDAILGGTIGFIGENENYLTEDDNGELDRAPYLVKPLGCVDCRVFGENNIPEYWIEE